MGKRILAKGKESRKKNLEENKGLKLKKNWYPVSDAKTNFIRKCKVPKKTHVAPELKPGQVVILLSGRFRGRRVIYLKKLETGLLLVTGPYKYNGVPLKRVNPAYVLPTNTFIKFDEKIADKIDNKFFKKVDIERKSEKDFFVEDKVKKDRITAERKDAQNKIDESVKKAVDAVPMMKDYLKNRFALKDGDKPHLMKF